MGGESLWAFWTPSTILIYSKVFGANITKNDVINPPESEGVQSGYKIINGKIPLFGNSIDNLFVQNRTIFAFPAITNNHQIAVEVCKEKTGYFYLLELSQYNNMVDDNYIACATMIDVYASMQYWPTE